ncbi:Protein-export membrane protein SecG [Tepidimonas alkaliphilus]|uniref:Protein-export membrane protein SecG n=1 Tax=Tepidimonas alkaliphilus TaxID=2588942 RepID=A0A554WCZ7_9BURK|nr:preprotein translocase subunit SecG [Tepidimonas alkaliphilus]TSE21452.1 Protein-export membrane protein SecG [Tepidimonas alkaliphilus]
MNVLHTLLVIVQVLSALAMIGLVLVQHGKGADAGAAFGGTSASLFGASGGANFLSRSTAVLATVFLASTLGLAFIGYQRPQAAAPGSSVLERAAPPAPAAPAAPAAPPAGAADQASQIPGK